MEQKSNANEEKVEKQPFHFRALLANYDYLCELTRHDRFRSLNMCLNIILTLLRKHRVESLVELKDLLRTQGKRDGKMEETS
jgi:hypothetical protein